MDKTIEASIIETVSACEAAILTTIDGDYPESRHILNILNSDARDLNLHFATTKDSPKCMQIAANPHVCLYYFNPENRHAVRLFGTMEVTQADAVRRKYWLDTWINFGYKEALDPKFSILVFTPKKYKFYSPELKEGEV